MPDTAPAPGVDFPFTVWDIANMERKLPDGDVPPDGQIYTIHYTVTHYDQGESAGAYGSIGLGDPDPDNYTPFADITKEQAIDWVKSALGDEQVATITAALEAQIQEKLNPTHATGTPW
jgi:hypothetical protein